MGFLTDLAKTYENPDYLSDDADRYIRKNIPDIPVLICEDNSICCIPWEDEVDSMCFAGMSGQGKTLLAQRVGEHIFHHWGDKLGMFFDVSEETYRWADKMDCREFNEANELHVNQEPCGLPMTFVYPNTNTLTIDEKIKSKINSYVRITLPFKEILQDLGFYLAGINPDFKLDRSEMYINNLKEPLSECENRIQIKETLEEELPGSDGKSFQAMRVKIFNAFDSLFNEEILDISHPEYPAYLKMGDFTANPLAVLMKANRVPALITSDLTNKKYQSAVISYYVNSIMKNKQKEFPNDRVWIMFDELWDLCKQDNEPASKAIGRVATRGRIKDVGLIYSTQFYDKIPNSVKGAKLNYLFSFQTSSERASKIASDFDLPKIMKERIINLKKFECIAMTRNKFRFYKNDQVWEDTKPVFGRILFPLSGHRKAGEKF